MCDSTHHFAQQPHFCAAEHHKKRSTHLRASFLLLPQWQHIFILVDLFHHPVRKVPASAVQRLAAVGAQDIRAVRQSEKMPLFAVGTLLSVLLSKKFDNQKLLTFGLLFSGIFIILLTFLNIYHLQMLMPLMKTNSITLAVMWIARIMGGLTGLFIGISFGAAVKNDVLHYILLVLFAAGIFALGRFMPELISYEPVLYAAGGLSLACALLNSYIETEKKKNE